MKQVDLRSIGISLLFLAALVLIAVDQDRSHFLYELGLYVFAFITYLLLLKKGGFSYRQYLVLLVVAYSTFLFTEPGLSNDYFRFIWDGEMIHSGINPYDFTPQELMEQARFSKSTYFQEIFNGMSDLSKSNYSCYPIFNQVYFSIGTFFSDSVFINVVIMRALIMLTYLLCIRYFTRLTQLLEIPVSRLWLFMLNPLWIIETIGNLHFEGVMLAFMLMGTYFLLQNKILYGGPAILAAIQMKLVPFMLLPFFYRYLGVRRSMWLYLLIGSSFIATSAILIDQDNFSHFTESLLLYFQVFEFNTFIFHYYLEFGEWKFHWRLHNVYGPRLTKYVILTFLLLSLYGEIETAEKLLKRFLVASTVYLLFSTTVHPWYILPLLAYGLLSGYIFPLWWSFVVFLSYASYSEGIISDSLQRMLINLEYISVIFLFLYEMIRKRPLLDKWFPKTDPS